MRNPVLLSALLSLTLGQMTLAWATDLKLQTTTTATPTVGTVGSIPQTTVGTVAPATLGARPAVPLQYKQSTDTQDPATAQDPSGLLQPLLDSLTKGAGGGSNGLAPGAPASLSNYVSSGTMSSCGSVPASVMGAYHEAQAFRQSCAAAQRGDQQKIAISDFSNRIPTMWIFDANGNCLKKTAVTYGNGLGNVAPQACADDGEHLTPPGFHLTCVHDGPKYATNMTSQYKENDALGECSLEGQGSVSRGVVIHRAKAPGTASSFGCSGVCDRCFDEVKATLGLGALVYNYFGNNFDPKCNSKAGQSHFTSCSVEGVNPPAVESPVPGTGQSVLQDGTTSQ